MRTTGYNSINSWGIAVACSFINCLGLLPIRVAGLLFVEFIYRYDTDRQNAALFVVIYGIFGSCSSPLIGYLGEIFELRSLTMWGCFIASLGVGICYFAEGIITVTVSLGFLYGIGLDLQQNLLPQVLKQHFTKNFATANGVLNIGSSAGSLAIIPLFKMLLDMYGISGALLMTCGLMLHGVPVAMLLRDPKYKKPNSSKPYKELDVKEGPIVFKKTFKEQSSFSIECNPFEKSLTGNPVIKDNGKSMEEFAVEVKGEENKIAKNSIAFNVIEKEGCSHPNLPLKSPINKEIDLHKTILSNEVNQTSTCELPSKVDKRSTFIKPLKTLGIFTNPPFLVIILCHSVFAYTSMFINTIVIDASKDKGIPESQAQFFLMLTPIASTVGYMCLGWVTDRGYLTAARYLSIGFLCLGLSCCGFAISNSFLTMAFSVAGFGLCVSTMMSVGPSLVYEFVEETKQSVAISSRFMLNGPFYLTMGPTIQIEDSNDKDIPQNQVHFFLMLPPIASTVGFICLGWVTDRGYLTSARYLSIGFLCLRLSCCGFAISNSFVTMAFSVAGFGLCVSTMMSVGPSLVYEFVEETKQSVAISSRFMLNGPLYLTMGPTIRWVTDRGYLTAARYLSIDFLCLGLSCCGFAISNSFLTMAFSVAGFGLCVSTMMSVGPSLVYEFVEETKQSVAISSRFMLNGPFYLTMGPTIQYFRGTLGSYNGAYYVLAAISVACSALLLFLPCIARCTNRKTSRSSTG